MTEALNYKLLSPWKNTATSFKVTGSTTIFKPGMDYCSNNPVIACPFAPIRESIEGKDTSYVYKAHEIEEFGVKKVRELKCQKEKLE